MPGEWLRSNGAPLLVAVLLVAWAAGAQGQCMPVIGEFVLTGLSNPDGNRANHEAGICLPHFMLNFTSSCILTLRPKYASAAYISLLQTGHEADGSRILPLASDPALKVNEYVNHHVGYYYLEPRRCPQVYSARLKGAKLLAADVANLLRKGLGVSASVLPAVSFDTNGLTIAWMTAGPRAQELSYTAIRKAGGPTVPDFSPVAGTPSTYCPLLDINPALDLDSNPADGIADDSTVTLVGRVPRSVPGRKGRYVCAIAPAGGYVKATKATGLAAAGGAAHRYAALQPNAYAICSAGGYLYRLGAVNAPGDASTDYCMKCPRGSFAAAGAALCGACPAGSFQDAPGQRRCKACEWGYAPLPGAARCVACYYGRPYCSEGFSPDPSLFSCNSERLPEGYSPDAGFTVVTPLDAPTETNAAERFAPLFRNCDLRGGGGSGGGGGGSLLAFNVSAECRVSMYVLGDLGRTPAGCSQNTAANAITAHYTAPNILAGLSTRGLSGWRVGFLGKLDGDGLASRVFAASAGVRVPLEFARPALMTLVLPESGWSYLGGGDNGQGLNINLKGINYDPCPPGTIKEMLNGDGVEDPGEDPNKLLSHYCVPCGIGTYCSNGHGGGGVAGGGAPYFGSGAAGGGGNGSVAVGGGGRGSYSSASGDYSSGGSSSGSGGGGYSLEAGRLFGPQNCPAGTYGTILGAKDANGCVNCPVGTYQDMDGSFTCVTCAPNTFASAPGSTECTSCGDGYVVGAAGSNFCNPCSPGTYRDSAASDTCADCPAGTSSGEAAGQCSVCEPGTYSATARSAACTECPRGSYQRAYGQRRCAPCPAGTYSDSRGRSSCKVCPVGTFNPNNGSVTAAACMRCPAGKAAPRPGSGRCSACGAGYFTDRTGSPTCRACPAGTYAKSPGARDCTPCPKGWFSDKAASRGCKPCAIGFFASQAGASKCMSCPAGAFTSAAASSYCSRCRPGTYSTRAAADSPVACAVCPPGTYSFMAGASACLQCPAGQFAARGGATGCEVCPLGTYAPGSGSQRCLPCKAGLTTPRMGAVGAAECRLRVVLNSGGVV